MIIDAHVHVFYNLIKIPEDASAKEFMKRGAAWFEYILAVAGDAGIDRLCILGEPPSRLTLNAHKEAGPNGLLLYLLDRYPDNILGGFPRINPNNREAALLEMEKCFKNKKVIGVKVGGTSGCPGSLKADSPKYKPVMEKLHELDALMLMHAWNKTTGNYEEESTPFEVAEMAKKFPCVKIIMAHLSGANYDGILAIAPHKNIFVDISGGYPEAGFLEWAVDILGPERIIFGSDATGRDFSVQMAKVTGADLSDDIKSMILGENMLRILGDRIRI